MNLLNKIGNIFWRYRQESENCRQTTFQGIEIANAPSFYNRFQVFFCLNSSIFNLNNTLCYFMCSRRVIKRLFTNKSRLKINIESPGSEYLHGQNAPHHSMGIAY